MAVLGAWRGSPDGIAVMDPSLFPLNIYLREQSLFTGQGGGREVGRERVGKVGWWGGRGLLGGKSGEGEGGWREESAVSVS